MVSIGMVLFKPAKAYKKFDVGLHKHLQSKVEGLDSHHVGQAKVMEQFIPDYNRRNAPAILVPSRGHTSRGPNGRLSTKTTGFENVRQVVARDIKELRRVYPDVPNSQLQKLIRMNKEMYPQMGRK